MRGPEPTHELRLITLSLPICCLFLLFVEGKTEAEKLAERKKKEEEEEEKRKKKEEEVRQRNQPGTRPMPCTRDVDRRPNGSLINVCVWYRCSCFYLARRRRRRRRKVEAARRKSRKTKLLKSKFVPSAAGASSAALQPPHSLVYRYPDSTQCVSGEVVI
jgi:hypothetical protein